MTRWQRAPARELLGRSLRFTPRKERSFELLRKRDPASSRALDQWLAGLEAHYADRILPITAAIADRSGRLSPDQPLPVCDGLLAATGIEHKLTIVTRNTADLLRSGVNTFDPFLPHSGAPSPRTRKARRNRRGWIVLAQIHAAELCAGSANSSPVPDEFTRSIPAASPHAWKRATTGRLMCFSIARSSGRAPSASENPSPSRN